MESFRYHYAVAGVPPTADEAAIEEAKKRGMNRDWGGRKLHSCRILQDITTRLQHDCDVGVRAYIMEKRISHGRQLVAAAAAAISEMEKRVADSDKALVDLESRWSYLAGPDNARGKLADHAIFQDRIEDARACRTELEAECVIKSKRLAKYLQEIQEQLSDMESTLAKLKAEKRDLMVPLPGMKNTGGYYKTLRQAWEDAEKRAEKLTDDGGLGRHTWPVHQPLNATEYAKERMLYLSNIIHQTGSAKRDLAKEIEKRDAQIREKDTLLAEKDDQLQGKDDQIRRKDAQIRAKDAEIQQKDAQIRQLDARYRRIHPRIVEVEDTDEAPDCQ